MAKKDPLLKLVQDLLAAEDGAWSAPYQPDWNSRNTGGGTFQKKVGGVFLRKELEHFMILSEDGVTSVSVPARLYEGVPAYKEACADFQRQLMAVFAEETVVKLRRSANLFG